MSTSQQFDRVGQIAVPSDLAVMCPVEADDLGQYMRVACVGFGAGRGMPLPIRGSREWVDRERQVSSRLQGHYPRAAVSFDSYDDLFCWKVHPLDGCMFGDQRM